MMASPKRQRGVALLVALLVVALAVVLIAALLDRGELALARTRNGLRAEQAQAYAQGLEAYAAGILRKTADESAQTRASPWTVPLPPQEVPGGVIAASMRDLDGCFNLNNLAPDNPQRASWSAVFRRLLARLGLGAEIGEAVEAWLDPEKSAREANFYLGQPVPYRPRGGPFVHVSELRLVRGVGSEAYAALAPHVCALPSGTLLNVNTATLPVLWSLGDMTQAEAERLWNGGNARYGSANEFLEAAGWRDNAAVAGLLDVRSNHFLARSEIVLDAVPFTFYSLIERSRLGGLRVLQRSHGADAAPAAMR